MYYVLASASIRDDKRLNDGPDEGDVHQHAIAVGQGDQWKVV